MPAKTYSITDMNLHLRSTQSGLASLELMLTAPILLSICYLIFRITDTAALWEQRIIESRNAAYRTEIYNTGNQDFIDTAFKGYETVIGNLTVQDDKEGRDYGNNRVKRYSTSESQTTYQTLVDEPRQTNKNKYMRPRAIRDLTSTLDDTQKIKIDSTVGVGFSYYYSPVGRLKNMFLEYQDDSVVKLDNVLREKHYADFANNLDLSSNRSLCTGYDDQMVALLSPNKLYSTTFPRDNTKCAIKPIIDIPDL